MINTLLPLLCINFIWLQQVFPTYSTHWIVAYPVDNAIHSLNNGGQYCSCRCCTSTVKMCRQPIILPATVDYLLLTSHTTRQRDLTFAAYDMLSSTTKRFYMAAYTHLRVETNCSFIACIS